MSETTNDSSPKLIEADTNMPTRLILDIGAADGSMATKYHDGRNFEGNEYYIGIDSGYEEVVHDQPVTEAHPQISLHDRLSSQSRIADKKHGEGRAQFLAAKANALPFKSESIQEITLGNFLGAPVRPGVILDTLSEAHRVIQEGGELVISENNTPLDPELAKLALLESGFIVKESYGTSQDLDAYNEQVKKRGVFVEFSYSLAERYIYIAQKASPKELEQERIRLGGAVDKERLMTLLMTVMYSIEFAKEWLNFVDDIPYLNKTTSDSKGQGVTTEKKYSERVSPGIVNLVGKAILDHIVARSTGKRPHKD